MNEVIKTIDKKDDQHKYASGIKEAVLSVDNHVKYLVIPGARIYAYEFVPYMIESDIDAIACETGIILLEDNALVYKSA